MTTLFMVCAVIGGTVLFLQVALMLFGFAGDGADMDADIDVDVDIDTDFDADAAGDDIGEIDHAGTVSAFRVLSFRTVVAALTFFGLGGLAAQSHGLPPLWVLAVAAAAGAGALYVVYWMFRAMRKVQASGTVRISRAVGRAGTVYVPIPENNAGAGKIQLNLQNRTMEYLAMTSGERLSTGAKVVVTGIVTADTLEVEPVPEPERHDHV